MTHNLGEGQKVRYVRHVVGGDDVDVQIGQHFTVDMIRDNTEAGDAFGPVTIHAHRDGDGKRFVFHQDEVEPLRSDESVPATDEEVTAYLTGTVPTVDHYRCDVEGCEYELSAAGPVDIDEPDEFQEQVDRHRESHELDAERGTVGEISAVDIWWALQEVPELMDLLARVAALPRPAVARALRAVAAVVDPEAGR